MEKRKEELWQEEIKRWRMEEDIRMTRQMKAAGELMGIPLVDHIILGDREYVSFAERFGWMRTGEDPEAAEGREFYGPPQTADPCTGKVL